MAFITDILETGEQFAYNSVGFGSPEDQIVSALVIAAALIATSAVSAFVTLLLLPIPLGLAAIGVLRLSSTIDGWWPLS